MTSSGPARPGHEGEERDAEADQASRQRGLAAPYIDGGRDPDPDQGLREERFYGRLLLIMVALIVASGFVLGIVQMALR
jgi:hypothetical protein